ncbi:MAG: hypothetical protein FWE04_03850 [Oscillospiraceae bacterium]|nr:hypothetical protein [Oscillospiraceae bacterium]
MRGSILKKICALFALLFVIVTVIGCNNSADDDSIRLTIMEQRTTRHVEQALVTKTQAVRLGDVIMLDGLHSDSEHFITIKEIQDNSVIVQIDDSLWHENNTYHNRSIDPVEIEYGEEYWLRTPTRSSHIDWILVFEQ